MNSIASVSEFAPTYRARLAETTEDLHAAQRLRFEVFNLELSEGLDTSWRTYRDEDRFDEGCDHLLVEHTATGRIVGTYRLQTGAMAAANHGYYSAQEFDFAPFEPYRDKLAELGRACVHKDHRKSNVLNLLWRGIANYARARSVRYLVGCSSLNSQDPALGHAMFAKLQGYLAAAEFHTIPHDYYAMPATELLADCPEPPRLLRTYLTVGAKICGPAALDREFGTIDFLTLIDLRAMPSATHNRFLS